VACGEKEPGQRGRGRPVKSREDRKESSTRGYWCEFPRIPVFTPVACFHPRCGYRLTAIRLNLFHHKRLNKEVHSSGPAAAGPRLPPVPFRSGGRPYRTLSTAYDHPSGSPFLKREARSCEIATPAIVRWTFSRYSRSIVLDLRSATLGI
jgi:hypothetical protein